MEYHETEIQQQEEKVKVYMIGKIDKMDKKVLVHCKKKFNRTKEYLISKGFDVINPTETFLAKEASVTEVVRKNLKKLADCNAVYIMPCACLQNENNTEVKMALNLKMTILHTF